MKRIFIFMIISSLGLAACDSAASDDSEQETIETAAPVDSVQPSTPVVPPDTANSGTDSASESAIRL